MLIAAERYRCVIAEMFRKTPIFPGESDTDQAHKIFQCADLLTSPSPSSADPRSLLSVADVAARPTVQTGPVGGRSQASERGRRISGAITLEQLARMLSGSSLFLLFYC